MEEYPVPEELLSKEQRERLVALDKAWKFLCEISDSVKTTHFVAPVYPALPNILERQPWSRYCHRRKGKGSSSSCCIIGRKDG